jgi:hypothetical protein
MSKSINVFDKKINKWTRFFDFSPVPFYGETEEENLGYQCSFDGISQTVNCGSNPSLDLGGLTEYTFLTWLVYGGRGNDGDGGTIAARFTVQEMVLGWLFYYYDDHRLFFMGDVVGVEDEAVLTIGTKYQVGFRRSGTQFQFIVNGQLIGSPHSSEYISQVETNFILGAYDGTNQSLKGSLDETALWTRDLTSSELLDTYNNGEGLYLVPTNVFPSTDELISLNLVGLWHLDEGVGTLTDDSSDNSNVGTLTSDTMWQTGFIPIYGETEEENLGYQCSFDGISQTVNCGSNPSLDLGGLTEYTFLTWLVYGGRGNDGDGGTIAARFTVQEMVLGWLFYYYDDHRLFFMGDVVGVEDEAVLTIGTKYQVGFRRSGTQFQFIVNGQLIGSPHSSEYISQVETNFILGAYDGTNQSLKGSLDETALWTRDLTSSELLDTYNNGEGLYLVPTNVFPSTDELISLNLVGLWHLDEGVGTLTDDSSDNSNVGTLTSDTMWQTGFIPIS